MGYARKRIGILLVLTLAAGGVLAAESFDELRKNISKSVATQPEPAIATFLKAGLEEHKQSQAYSVAQGWFMQNKPRNAETLRLAALTAEQGAHFADAVAFYQQYLAKADPKSRESQRAVMSLYRLMIDVMRNKNNSAYQYMLNNSERFMPYGSARQFNTWLLNQAWKGFENSGNMRDFVNILAAVSRSGYSRTELDAVYGDYYNRILTTRDERGVGALDRSPNIALGAAVAELGKSITHDERLKLTMTFLGEVWRYNTTLYQAMEHNKKKGVAPRTIPSPPLAAAEALLQKYPDAGGMVWHEFLSRKWRGGNDKWTLSKEGEGDAKKALVKKYLKRMPADGRYVIRSRLVSRNDKSKQAAMVQWFDSKKVKPETTEAEFRKLLADFDAPSPKLPNVCGRLIVTAEDMPSTWPEMMKDDDRQVLFFRTITQRLRLNTAHLQYARNPGDKHDGPISAEPHLRKLVEAQAGKGKIIPWLTMAWVNSYKPQWSRVKPSDPAGVELMKKLMAMPQYASLPYQLRMGIARSLRSHGPEGDKLARAAADGHVFGALLALKEDADAAAVKAACRTTLERLEASPRRVNFDRYNDLDKISASVLEDPEVISLLLQVSDNPSVSPWIEGGENLFNPMLANLVKSTDYGILHRHAYGIWLRSIRSIGGRHRNYTYYGQRNKQMFSWMDEMMEQNPSAAAAMTRAATQLAPYEKQGLEGILATLGAYLNRANLAMGIRAIAVDESDPAYPLYKSQAEYAAGNEDSAWQLFDENTDMALSMHRKLSAEYWLWALEKLIYQNDAERQERVIKTLQAWRSESATAFSKGQSVMLDILYGDIARRRGGRDLDNALKIYRSIVKKKEYADVLEYYTAMLRCIEVERVMKDFDGALETANNLIHMRVPEFWATARFAKAEIYYDMEDYDEVKDLLDGILARDPNHKDAKILEGKVLIKQKSLVDATEVEIASKAVTQDAISPGEWMKVTLTDPTLAVSGGGVDIEVDVWATSGDRETILLAQFGDSKTKFRGKALVELGKPQPGDSVLQVIGDDEIYYEYAKSFMEKVNMKDPKRGGPLKILSDATLMASARKLLSVAEQKQADAIALLGGMGRRGGARGLDNEKIAEKAKGRLAAASVAERSELEQRVEQAALVNAAQAMVKPGNPIYIRVADEDSSRTDGIDQVMVSVESSSGDIVGQIVLKETGPYTGVFEGKVNTGGAQAMAFASSTRPGLNPNMLISPKRHDAWRSAPGKAKGQASVTVDLNDNVPLQTLTIAASEPGFALQGFRLLSGLNRTDLYQVATWPSPTANVDPAAPSVTMVLQPPLRQVRRHSRGAYNSGNDPKQAYDLKGMAEYVDSGYLAHGAAHVQQVSGPSQAFAKTAWVTAPWIHEAKKSRQRSSNKNIVSRFRAYFYVEDAETRHFAVALGEPPKELSVTYNDGKDDRKLVAQLQNLYRFPTVVTLNGKPLEKGDKVYKGEFRLSAGLQKIEIFSQGAEGTIGFGRDCKVFTRLPTDRKWSACTSSMFDPTTFPQSARDEVARPARVERNQDGTVYTVNFPRQARARVLALECVKHEGPEASISKLELTAVGGKRVLPVATDYAEVRKNDTLEILSGDRIWVRYVDDRYASKSKERQERELHAGYANAEVDFRGIEIQITERSKQTYEDWILRFQHNVPLPLMVADPDMDETDKPDKVEVTLVNKAGQKKTVVLTETEASSGVFSGAVTPVAGPASNPGEFQAAVGDIITMAYWDRENVSPGVPALRKDSIRHAKYQQPKMIASHMTAGEPKQTSPDDGLWVDSEKKKNDEVLPPIGVTLTPVMVGTDPAKVPTFFPGCYAYVDIVAPYLAIRPRTTLRMFAQTETGRRLAAEKRAAAAAPGETAGAAAAPVTQEAFDVTVPGTRLLNASPVETTSFRYSTEGRTLRDYELGIYGVNSPNPFDEYWQKYVIKDLTCGIFRAPLACWPGSWNKAEVTVDTDRLLRFATAGTSRPLSPEELKQFNAAVGYAQIHSKHYRRWLSREERCRLLDPLVVKPGEKVYIGFRYEDDKGQAQWLTATANTVAHGYLMARADRDGVAHSDRVALGDKIRVRALDLGYDVSDDQDTIKVQVSAKSGATYPLELKESAAHSGEFEGFFELLIDDQNSTPDRNISAMGFPAAYGDTISIAFRDSGGRDLPPTTFTLEMGADGTIEPFTKQYGDDEIAVKTQFAMAESFLESAKSYRKIKKMREAELSYRAAKQLLSTTMERFTDPAAHARAEYLLGDLAYEEARSTTDKDLQEQRYHAALARFTKVVARYPNTVDAAKAQFKKAVTHERIREPEAAAAEYVKLAYMYPDSEFLAVAMYRLGAHFRTKAKRAARELAPLQQKIKGKERKDVDRDLLFEIDQLIAEKNNQYTKAGKIFSRVLDRFPSHELAGNAGLRAAQCFYAAEDYKSALAPLNQVSENENYEPVARAEALYWAGKCYNYLGEFMAAYSKFILCTEDFPETEWSGYCLAELSQPRYQGMDEMISEQRQEKGYAL